MPNRLGLHARPAARFVETASRFDAAITVADETTGRGPADARSLSALITLAVRQGHTILLRASGAQASEALAALRELADDGFGDDDGAPAPAEPPAPPPTPESPPVTAGTVLQGIPASAGIVIAPARKPSIGSDPALGLTPIRAEAASDPLWSADLERSSDPSAGSAGGTGSDPAEEWGRLERARAAARGDVEAARDRIAEQAGAEEAAIFDAHLLLLDDSALLDPARRAIEGGASAAAAWGEAARATAEAYRGLDDPYLRERADDVEDVGGRVLRHLTGAPAPGAIEAPGVLVVRDLTPGDAAALDRERVQGIAVGRGGATSHAAILARALGIPAVVGLGERLGEVADGTLLVLDGDAGTIEVDPPADTLAEREQAREAAERRRARARERATEPARMRDGETIEVAANVGSAADAAAAVELGADGVGLLRTEFLFLDRDEAPSEDEQVAVYEEIAAALEGRPVIVRTLDAGADKPLRFLPQAQEDNPFLGVRGIRLGLAHPELLRTQLRAIATVAARHPLKVMFPMVATLDEYRQARAMIDADVEVGVMLEVPAMALQADAFAREVDFFSVGTNDLTQYTMAAERGNEALAGLLAGLQAPVLRLIAAAVEAARAHGRWVGVCGELAGEPEAAVVLAGLGVARAEHGRRADPGGQGGAASRDGGRRTPRRRAGARPLSDDRAPRRGPLGAPAAVPDAPASVTAAAAALHVLRRPEEGDERLCRAKYGVARGGVAPDAQVRPADELLEVDDRGELVARDASPFGAIEAFEQPGRDALLDPAAGAAIVDDLADVRVPRGVASERPRDVAGLDVREGHPRRTRRRMTAPSGRAPRAARRSGAPSFRRGSRSRDRCSRRC